MVRAPDVRPPWPCKKDQQKNDIPFTRTLDHGSYGGRCSSCNVNALAGRDAYFAHGHSLCFRGKLKRPCRGHVLATSALQLTELKRQCTSGEVLLVLGLGTAPVSRSMEVHSMACLSVGASNPLVLEPSFKRPTLTEHKYLVYFKQAVNFPIHQHGKANSECDLQASHAQPFPVIIMRNL